MINTDTILKWNAKDIAGINEINGSGTGIPNLLGGDIEVKGFSHKKHYKSFQRLKKDFLSRKKGVVTIKHPNPVNAEWEIEAYIKSIVEEMSFLFSTLN